MTPFWRSWLIGWSYFVMLFGLVLVGAGLPQTDAIARTIFGIIGATNVDWTPHLRFATSLMGAVTLGWGMTTLVAIRAALALGDAGTTTWRGILSALLIWYVLDSFMSVATGFWMNAVSNSIIFAAFSAAMLATGVLSDRRHA